MGREIRRVPVNWHHPKSIDYDGYQPLRDDYIGSMAYWKKDVNEFITHMTEVIKKGKTRIYNTNYTNPKSVYDYLTEDNILAPPNIDQFMPSGPWYQLYENVSEGTPLSPPFKTKPELVKWLSINKDFWDHKWTPEQAAAMVKSGYAPSGIMANGKIYTAEESVLLK